MDVLLVESENDSLVPHQVIANYREAFISAKSTTYRVISGADHALSDDTSQRAYSTVLVTWLSEMVLGARSPESANPPPPPKIQLVTQTARPAARDAAVADADVKEPLHRRQ